MNFAESLAYWYLRFNGFFPIVDFVLHRSDGDERPYTADCDLLAVRFPHVFEEIGGRENDWDTRRFNDWGITLSTDTVGLMVEVKSGSLNHEDLTNKSFAPERWRRAVQRFGIYPNQEAIQLAAATFQKPLCRSGDPPIAVAKLLIADQVPAEGEDRWLSMRLSDAEVFVVQRMRCYERKLLDRMFFPDALAQYLAWKYGGLGGQVARGRRQRG